MTRQRRTYSEDEKAQAVGLAVTIGVTQAGRQLGIPHRNISNWVRDPVYVRAVEVSHDRIIETLQQAAMAAASEVLRVIRDPKAADRDKVRAAEVALDRYQLMSGGATERTENLNVEVDASPAYTKPEIRAELIEWMATIERASDEELAQHEARAERFLQIAGNVATYVPGDDSSTRALRDSIDEADDVTD